MEQNNQMAGREVGANFKGILNTPSVGKDVGTHSNQEATKEERNGPTNRVSSLHVICR
jgi:hypothetical protein